MKVRKPEKEIQSEVVKKSVMQNNKRPEKNCAAITDQQLKSAQFEAAFEGIADAVLIYSIDQIVAYSNPGARRLFEFDPTGLSIWEIYQKLMVRTEDGRPLSKDEIPSSQAVKGDAQRGVPLRYKTASDQNQIAHVSAAPIRLNGQIVGGVSIWRDMTEHEALLVQLQASEARFRSTFENAAVGMAHISLDGRFLRVNPVLCQITGYTCEELQCKTFQEITVPEDLAADLYLIDQIRRKVVERQSMEKRYIRKDGQIIWVNLTVAAQRRPDGDVDFFIVSVEEITDRKATEQALLESEAELRIRESYLRESEARFHLLADHIPQLAWMADEKGWIFWYNQRWLDYTGTTLEEMQGWGWQKVHHPDHVEQVTQKYREHIQRGETWEDIFPLRSKEGEYRWFLSRAIPIQDEMGNVVRWFGTNTDITEQRETEQQLRLALSRLEQFVNSNMVGIVIGDEEGNITEANDYYLNMLGYTRAELSTHRIRWVDLTPPEHLPADRRALAELARRGVCTPYEKQYFRKDGTRVWVLIGDAILPNHQIIAFVLDISAQKKTDADLRKALALAEEGQRTLEALMRYVPEGISITGGPPDFPIRMASQYGIEMTGKKMEDLLGQKAGEHQAAWGIYFPDGITIPAPEQLPLYRASHYGEEVLGEELLIERLDGKKIPILVNAAPVRDERGHIIAAINSWRDITERKETEQALQHYADELASSNQDLENFAFVASHDLQEPLRKIASFGDILNQRLSGQIDEATEDILKRMMNASDRMKGMINDLLELSRINTRGQAFVQVDLSEVAAEVLTDLETAIQRTSGQIEIGPLPSLEGDPLQIRQLLQNLIANALKFHKPGEPPRVTVTGKLIRKGQLHQGLVSLTVADQGIGFDMEYFERILQPFQRLHGRSEYEGTGIGLAICKRIVERHHGQISARSAPGEGATFTIELPVKQPG